MGFGSSLGVDWLQEGTVLCLAALADIFLSVDLVVLAVLVDGWGLRWRLDLWTERVAGSVGKAGLHLAAGLLSQKS